MSPICLPTLHLRVHEFVWLQRYQRVILALVTLLFSVWIMTAPTIGHAILAALACGGGAFCSWYLYRRSQVGYTLTATHFQQHLFKGGWAMQWKNIQRLGQCHYRDREGWSHPVPWIGFKLVDYEPFIDAICPRVASEMLINQRGLLYLALRGNLDPRIEDKLFDTARYTSKSGRQFRGLQAMLAQRMRYQRECYGYDIFISTADLDRDIDSFIGLLRRYKAGAIT
ncbi:MULTISPECIES: DUF2982 domain-containing protein [unclassified Vibrio]|uniref:DUF2982 domain-containing protein n=1 Tax=Vibrio sp. HB236076 TaxID=3232307 RepID=A0AB39HAH0_9VIBR|nr:DUF2982 domain-containing protein [Vibrio sp. HB161653]MDP5253514.1 DUF2982 domain-containing protein [Vibrio sp. HB161653]